MDSIKCHLITLEKHGGIKKTKRLDAGSESVKYMLTAHDGSKYLLKIYSYNNERNVQLNAEINRRILENGIHTPLILEVGKTDVDLLPYELLEWIPGTSVDILLLGNAPSEEKYKRGIAAGKYLKRIHELDYHAVCEPKHMLLNKRIKYILEKYVELEIAGQYTYRGSIFRDYILGTPYCDTESKHCLLHGDFHIGNIIEGSTGDIWIIDWVYNLIGNPIEDFVRIFVSAEKSSEFAKGQIDGYFGGHPSEGFWESLKMLVAIQQLEILLLPLGKLSDGRDVCEHQHEIIFEQYKGMESIIPKSFFTDRDTILTDGKVVFVFDFDTTFFIQINERRDVFLFTVLVDRHCIMGRI
ncbi:aminoglycoside phosphotransferase family protein [Catonella sp. Marseille-Q4567]|uniref:Aminoglycoside phosphotransferase family protein n=1 Tax=Catonella massiliensis TaxID=2799636 RepID=A0ABS1J149_9FIRM|nr:aminoglycoside phosphotransferase family protein [Catonella massiliensis]